MVFYKLDKVNFEMNYHAFCIKLLKPLTGAVPLLLIISLAPILFIDLLVEVIRIN